jgi:hypothetical protein
VYGCTFLGIAFLVPRHVILSPFQAFGFNDKIEDYQLAKGKKEERMPKRKT